MTINYDRAINSKKNHHLLYDICKDEGLWVFGYGSLIWKPDFEYVKSYKALLHGYYRSLCVYSYHHRGTKENPGLVMGMKKGKKDAYCQGRAYYISPENSQETLINLRKREQVNEVYFERYLPVELDVSEDPTIAVNKDILKHRYINALFYEVDKAHIQYASKLNFDEKAIIIKKSRGLSGNNLDYVINLYKHFQKNNINDEYISNIYKALNS